MRITLRLSQENMDRYSDPAALRLGWQLVNLGNAALPDAAVAETDPEVLVVDAITPVSGALIAALPHLRLIQSQGVAYNRIDCDAAAARGVYVCNNAGVNADAVAEQAILLMLALLRQLGPAQKAVLAGEQIGYKNRCFAAALPELGDQHVGVVGMGAIGRALTQRLTAFGCRVSYYSRVPVADSRGAAYLPLVELLSACDIISLHAPVKPETLHMIGPAALNSMKPGALLINTARGELVDQEAVCAALRAGTLGGFGADTLSPEPVEADNPLLRLPPPVLDRVVLSPHIAGLTGGSFRRMYQSIWSNLAALEDGERPRNVVNGI